MADKYTKADQPGWLVRNNPIPYDPSSIVGDGLMFGSINDVPKGSAYPGMSVREIETGTEYSFEDGEFILKGSKRYTYDELKVLKDAGKLQPGKPYILKDYLHKYIIQYTNSTVLRNTTSTGHEYVVGNKREEGGKLKIKFIANGETSAWEDSPRHIVGASANVYFIEKLDGSAKTYVTDVGWYDFTVNSLDGFEVGDKLIFSGPGLPEESGINADQTINDSNGRPVITPNGILNTDVHNGEAYGSMTAEQNPRVQAEDLILRATTNNRFAAVAFSSVFPEDTVFYDFDDNEITAGKNKIARQGFIYARENRKQRIKTNFNFREQRYRRWELNLVQEVVTPTQAPFKGNMNWSTAPTGERAFLVCFPGQRVGISPEKFDLTKVRQGEILTDETNATNKHSAPLTVKSNTSFRDFKAFDATKQDVTDIDIKDSDNIVFMDSFVKAVRGYGVMKNVTMTGWVVNFYNEGEMYDSIFAAGAYGTQYFYNYNRIERAFIRTSIWNVSVKDKGIINSTIAGVFLTGQIEFQILNSIIGNGLAHNLSLKACIASVFLGKTDAHSRLGHIEKSYIEPGAVFFNSSFKRILTSVFNADCNKAEIGYLEKSQIKSGSKFFDSGFKFIHDSVLHVHCNYSFLENFVTKSEIGSDGLKTINYSKYLKKIDTQVIDKTTVDNQVITS